jgi:hypothetical protein
MIRNLDFRGLNTTDLQIRERECRRSKIPLQMNISILQHGFHIHNGIQVKRRNKGHRPHSNQRKSRRDYRSPGEYSSHHPLHTTRRLLSLHLIQSLLTRSQRQTSELEYDRSGIHKTTRSERQKRVQGLVGRRNIFNHRNKLLQEWNLNLKTPCNARHNLFPVPTPQGTTRK